MPRIASIVAVGFTLAACLDLNASSWRLGTEVQWHDNVTNAERPEDLLPALQWSTELDGGIARNLRDGHRIQGRGGLRVDAWPRFEGLDFLAPVFSAGWEFKPGLGSHRPVFAAEFEGEWRIAREHARGGLGGAGRLSVRQRLGSSWLLTAGHEWRRFDAAGRAFSNTGREWSGRVEWNVGGDWTLAAEARERFGDVVSYSRPPRPDLEAIGKPITHVDTFEQDVPWIAYYFRARTRSGAVEVQRAFSRTGVTLRHELRHTLHAGPGYRNQITTLRWVTSF